MEEKVEYSCECGRHFITIGQSGAKKCPKCARMMYPKGEKKKEEVVEDAFSSKMKKTNNPFGGLDETVEYEYKFDQHGQRLIKGNDPFTVKKFVKKIFSLFSFRGGRSYRNL